MFFDAHIKLAGDRIVKVLDTKRARRHLGVIEHPALLANHHPRVGAGHAADFRGIAPEVGRQHVVVAAQVDAGVAETAEQVRVQVVFADDQVRAQRRHGAQRIKTAPGEIVLGRLVVTALHLALPVAAQAPGAQVDAGGAVAAEVVATTFTALALGGLGVEVVVEQHPGNAFVPARGRVPVGRGVFQLVLGDAQVKRRSAQVATCLHARNANEVQAGAVVPPGQGLEDVFFQTQFLDQFRGKTGNAAFRIVLGGEIIDREFCQRIAVHMDRQAVLAGHDEVSRRKHPKIKVLAILEVKYIGVELEFFGCTCPRRGTTQRRGSQYLTVIHVTKSLSDTAH
ncbi:hypothetical protein D3C81_1051700 [compost metagenome]